MPRVSEASVRCKHKKRIVRKSGRHQDVLVQRVGIVVTKFLHVSGAQHLSVHLKEPMPSVYAAISLFRCVPEVQLESVTPERSRSRRLLGERGQGIKFNVADVI